MDLIGRLQKVIETCEKGLLNTDSDPVENTEEENPTKIESEDSPQQATPQTPEPCEPKIEEAEEEELLREVTYKDTPTVSLYGVSMRGRSHITDSKPCQDFHKVEALSDGWIIATVSDGAGSAAESARGSKANCGLACEMFKVLIVKNRWIENNYLPSQMEWQVEAYNIFSMIQDVIKRKAEEESVEARLFNATLLVIISTPRGLLSAHIGDGRMGYRTKDGQWQMLMIPHKGEEANQTVFIPNEWNKRVIPSFRMSGVYLPETYVIESSDIDTFVMLSDGCEQAMWKCHAWDESAGRYIDRNQPQEAFLNPLIEDISRCENQEEVSQRLSYIVREGTTACQREKDDQTLLIGILK